MANKYIFRSLGGSPPPADTVNEAGGKAFALPPRQARAQYAVTACLNGTFYASAETQLGTPEWTAIARNAGWQMTRMNLDAFARHGVFADGKVTRTVANRLRDASLIRKACVFPYQLMVAHRNANPEVPEEVRNALQDAMEIALENVPAVGGEIVVCPEVSGSMQSPVTGERKGSTTAVTCVQVAALVTAALLRKNGSAQVLPFSDDVVPVALNPKDSVMTNADKLAALPSGGTNCSAPIADLVVMASDNQSWVDGCLKVRPACRVMTSTSPFQSSWLR